MKNELNILRQIKMFWQFHEKHCYTTNEIALYFYLLETANIIRLGNQFKRNNAKIEADLSVSYKTLKNARNRLQTTGLIHFETKNGVPNVTYKIVTFGNLDEVRDEVRDEIIYIDKSIYKTKPKTNTDFENFICEFNQIRNTKFRGDKAAERQFNARLKEKFTAAEMLTAYQNAIKDEFHIKNNFKHLTPEFFTRADKINKFLNLTNLKSNNYENNLLNKLKNKV